MKLGYRKVNNNHVVVEKYLGSNFPELTISFVNKRGQSMVVIDCTEDCTDIIPISLPNRTVRSIDISACSKLCKQPLELAETRMPKELKATQGHLMSVVKEFFKWAEEEMPNTLYQCYPTDERRGRVYVLSLKRMGFTVLVVEETIWFYK